MTANLNPTIDPPGMEAVRRESQLRRLLMAFITTGLLFMLLPGTFLGVWNLISISSRHSLAALSPEWIQAHGHAQVFGWVGSFILGIGFFSISKMAGLPSFSVGRGWICWVLWTVASLRGGPPICTSGSGRSLFRSRPPWNWPLT